MTGLLFQSFLHNVVTLLELLSVAFQLLIVHISTINKINPFFISTDEPATDQILKSLQTFASVCGQLDLNSNRDAFISCICKMSLPENYAANNLHALLSKQPSYNVNFIGALKTESSNDSSGNNIVVSNYVKLVN